VHLEIERKYLLTGLPTMPQVRDVLEIEQGYIAGQTIHERLRREERRDGSVRFYRTVKVGRGVERIELEDETDERTFAHLWQLTEGRRLRKRRYRAPFGDDEWEIDEFTDRELVLAELEIPTIGYDISIPEWLAPVLVREVTDEPGYANSALAR
jgi:CYTH domain-containing protein